MAGKKYTGDPAFKLEIAGIAADHADQPISAEERAKLATPVTRPFAPLHKHEEDCWGDPIKRTIPTPRKGKAKGQPAFINVLVQICRRSGAIREVEEQTT
jgi:hypothetical protein